MLLAGRRKLRKRSITCSETSRLWMEACASIIALVALLQWMRPPATPSGRVSACFFDILIVQTRLVALQLLLWLH